MALIPNKRKVLRGSLTLRMLELGFAITVLELAAVLLPELGDRFPFDRLWLLAGASGAQFLAWVCRFILQPKISGATNADQ